MSDPNKPSKSNWLSLITPEVLGRTSARPSSSEGADYAQAGSICTQRHPGNEPPDSAIHVIARIR
jgi:hypothetical protein